MDNYDVVIIGAGPGGYVAAIKAAQLGAKVAVIEKGEIGGTCLNRGCIPTKAFVASANTLLKVKTAGNYGIKTSGYEIDFLAIVERKNKIVKQLRAGITQLFKSHNITLIKGSASFLSASQLQIVDSASTSTMEFNNCIIASGSVPAKIQGIEIDAKKNYTSDEILDLSEIPRSLLVIGGGVIGIEFVCIFNALGSKVTIIEALPSVLPNEDEEISKELSKLLARKGIEIKTGARVSVQDLESHEKVLVAVGRKANLNELNLERAGIQAEENRRIIVNERMQTNIKGIYAIGDAVGGIQLAHKASQEGIVASQNIMGKDTNIDYRIIPSCVYSIPEVASVGLTEKKAREAGYEIAIGKCPFMANGRAITLGETAGMVKTVIDKKTGVMLGVHIIGNEATELIAEAALGLKLEATIEELERIIHPHPTLSEAIAESAHASIGEAIDLP